MRSMPFCWGCSSSTDRVKANNHLGFVCLILLEYRALLKKLFLAGLAIAPSGFHSAFAQPTFAQMDCRHLLAEDVRLSDRVAVLKTQDSTLAAQTRKGISVTFDPIPGIGVMKGLTLVPDGSNTTAASDDGLESLQQKLSTVKAEEQRKVCPTIDIPQDRQDRLLDGQKPITQ